MRAQMTGGGVTGHITIQRGCDKFCTFCVVPYTRGRERGTPPREVLRQARAMAEAGYKEVQLLGQTVNSYRHEDVGFGDLLRAVATVDGIERIRFTSPYPLDFSRRGDRRDGRDAQGLQARPPAAADRRPTPCSSACGAATPTPTYRRLVAALRAAMPGIAITTDLLVGFCDETEDEFADRCCARRRSCASTARSCSRTRSGRARSPRARCPTPCPRR